MARRRQVHTAVTVDRGLTELEDSAALDPLRRLGPDAVTDLRKAPGSWGTEVHVRWSGAEPAAALDTKVLATLERALREVRSLAETGEVLKIEPRPAGPRPRTPGGALVDWAERHSDRFVALRLRWATRA